MNIHLLFQLLFDREISGHFQIPGANNQIGVRIDDVGDNPWDLFCFVPAVCIDNYCCPAPEIAGMFQSGEECVRLSFVLDKADDFGAGNSCDICCVVSGPVINNNNALYDLAGF
jgi:hypothetical protein